MSKTGFSNLYFENSAGLISICRCDRAIYRKKIEFIDLNAVYTEIKYQI